MPSKIPPTADLSADDAVSIAAAKAQAVVAILDGGFPNVIGVATGTKWTNGEPTGRKAVLVLVNQKVSEDALSADERVPKTINGTPTDVLNVGNVMAGHSADLVDIETLATRVRPARPGYSVGHHSITAGTIGAAVYDILAGGTASPPVLGIGKPARYYILSNNHVLANTNAGQIGDAILQPGPFDGGTNPADRIGFLKRFVPITLEPAVPRVLHRNQVDAAIAEVPFSEVDRNPYWISGIVGWRTRANVTVGTHVQKVGRTTHYTTGRIVATNATIDVGYGGGRVGRFIDQIVTTDMSAGGDSGSLVSTLDGVAIGLLFAGSATATILNQIENVRSLLRVEVSERVM